MYEFKLTVYKSEAQEKLVSWKFTPIDREPGFEILRSDKLRATGASNKKAFAIKEVWTITIGAGTLLFEDHRKHFLQFISAKSFVWVRNLDGKKDETEFELETDSRILFEYLQDRRSLKRKTFTIIEKAPNYYDSFEQFNNRYLQLIEDNRLW
jgi:hypothetical protein